jgi:hypothetical protein
MKKFCTGISRFPEAWSQMIPEDHKVNVSLFPVGLQQQL